MKNYLLSLLIITGIGYNIAFAQGYKEVKEYANNGIKVGAERTEQYIPLLKNKIVAIVANHTSLIGTTHLVDSLIKLGIKVNVIFAPEHGFRGMNGTGEESENSLDSKTGIPIISLYGKHNAPTAKDLQGVDIVVFDIQDVGVRFYTYLSTLHLVMQACAENNKQLFILDRPNPNGFYVDGPVLEKKYSSFVGMDPVPIVHGCTLAEFAKMINGEHWLKNNLQCDVRYVLCDSYKHSDFYVLPIKPSPNLITMSAVYLYPSLGLFEGTEVSVGRGTDMPFEIIGYPGFKNGSLKFTPKTIPNMAKNPPYENIECRGVNLKQFGDVYVKNTKAIYLFWLKGFYDDYPNKEKFFNSYFDQLAGTSKLRSQIKSGMGEDAIRASWADDLKKYKAIRKKYLLYEDFE
jgi:uncharacterized protein YbbC (DUF1343 family)